jgi:hypothetical protein
MAPKTTEMSQGVRSADFGRPSSDLTLLTTSSRNVGYHARKNLNRQPTGTFFSSNGISTEM